MAMAIQAVGVALLRRAAVGQRGVGRRRALGRRGIQVSRDDARQRPPANLKFTGLTQNLGQL